MNNYYVTTLISLLYVDVPEDWQMSFQDAASSIMEEIHFLHDHMMFIIPLVSLLVFWVILSSMGGKYTYKNLIEGTLMEVVWTIMPGVMLLFIAFPSLKLLYLMDETMESNMTMKVVGHQWYWSYEYSDYDMNDLEFDSYMLPTSDLSPGENSLLEVDNYLTIPIKSHISMVVTAADVIHSFAVPTLGIKMDAVPGSLNQSDIFMKSPGLFYGQCSEMCGSNHSFMPMGMSGVSLESFVNWVESSIFEN